MSTDIHPNLKQLSHSSANTLHVCPRKYELYKLAPVQGVEVNPGGDGDVHLDYGKVTGAAIQEYFVTEDINKAYMVAFMQWQKMIDDEAGEKMKKTFWHVLFAIDKFVEVRKTVFAHYDVAILNGRPAQELGFSIDCGDGFHYRGFVDIVLKHRFKKKLIPIECKTTKSYEVNEATFKNSGQGLGYGIVLDTIAPLLDVPLEPSYEVFYPVFKTLKMEWEVLPFIKSNSQRARWIKNLLTDKRHIIDFAANDYFPTHGEHCFSFFRQCPYFGTCEFKTELLVGKDPEVKAEAEDKYDYHFKLSELIEGQLAKV